MLCRTSCAMWRWSGAWRIPKCKFLPLLLLFVCSQILSLFSNFFTNISHPPLCLQASFLLEILHSSHSSSASSLSDLSLAVDVAFPCVTPEGREEGEEQQWQNLLVRRRVPRCRLFHFTALSDFVSPCILYSHSYTRHKPPTRRSQVIQGPYNGASRARHLLSLLWSTRQVGSTFCLTLKLWLFTLTQTLLS